jgi:hypothetical protein
VGSSPAARARLERAKPAVIVAGFVFLTAKLTAKVLNPAPHPPVDPHHLLIIPHLC